MGVLVRVLDAVLAHALSGPLLLRLMALATLVGGGLLGFAVLTLLTGAMSWRELNRRLKRRLA